MKAMQYGHPKFRVKIPRSLVVVTNMKRKLHLQCKDKATATANDRNNKGIEARNGDKFSRKPFGSVFLRVIGNKRSSSNEVENKPVVAALSQLLALEETLERVGGEAKRNRKDKQRVMMMKNFPLLRFLDKQKGWNKFMREKSKTFFARLRQVRRKTCSCRLFKIPSKILVVGLKLKMVRPLVKKKVAKRFDEDEEIELWKKRILMGRRCKPLSSPLTLGFYTDSLFLAEMEH